MIFEDDISSYKTGISIVKEMFELIKYLNENKIDVYVISASSKILVKTILKPLEKYITDIYGMEIDIKEDKLIGTYNREKINTRGIGKTEVIDKYIKPKYNKDPLIVAGDDIGDYEMLTKYKDTKISLLIDRNRNNKFKNLILSSEEKYVVQRVDETLGIFIDSDKSITI